MTKLLYNFLNFVFYLPVGGETSFRAACLRFAGISREDSILDICCGPGALAVALEPMGLQACLTGLDLSGLKIHEARKRAPQAIFVVGSADNLPFKPSTFNKCLVSFGLHHIFEGVRLDALKEANRVLVPDGAIYIFEYNLPERGWRRFAGSMLTRLDNNGEAFRMLNTGKLVRQIEDAGFEIVERSYTYMGLVQLAKAVKKTPPN